MFIPSVALRNFLSYRDPPSVLSYFLYKKEKKLNSHFLNFGKSKGLFHTTITD